MKRARLRVRGLVQGVYFRSELQERARSLRLVGWVRNVPDGSLEAVVEGEHERVAAVIDWCHRGPRGARVESVDVTWEAPRGGEGFRVVRERWGEPSP